MTDNLALGRTPIRNNPNFQVYHKLMVDTAMLLGADNETRVTEEMWDVIDLESQIATV